MRTHWLLFCSLFICSISIAEETNDLFKLSLSDLSQVRVSVASFFPESIAQAPSSVNLVTAPQWQAQGARTVAEAVAAVPGVRSRRVPVRLERVEHGEAGRDVVVVRAAHQEPRSRWCAPEDDRVRASTVAVAVEP